MKLLIDKRNYYKNHIFSYGINSKKLYSITRKLIGIPIMYSVTRVNHI